MATHSRARTSSASSGYLVLTIYSLVLADSVFYTLMM